MLFIFFKTFKSHSHDKTQHTRTHTQLRVLRLWGNELTGPLPGSLLQAWGNTLTDLDLSQNSLKGNLPKELGGQTCPFLKVVKGFGRWQWWEEWW